MTELTYKDGLPPSSEFRQALTQAMAMTNPVDDLLELSNRLREYEREHHMSSDDFYRRYQAGALDEELQHCVDWAAVYDLFLKTRRVLEATLMRAAVLPEWSEAAA